MTLREWVLQFSSLPTGNTVRQHLKHPILVGVVEVCGDHLSLSCGLDSVSEEQIIEGVSDVRC